MVEITNWLKCRPIKLTFYLYWITLSIITKLFSLEVQQGPSLIGPVFVQEETRVPGENMRCLVESNWNQSSHMRPRWNFILITALSRNRTRVTEVKGTCANHRTTNTPKSRTNFTQFYNRLILQWIVCLWGWNIVSVMASDCHLRCVIAMCHDSRDFLMRKSWSFVNHASVFHTSSGRPELAEKWELFLNVDFSSDTTIV